MLVGLFCSSQTWPDFCTRFELTTPKSAFATAVYHPDTAGSQKACERQGGGTETDEGRPSSCVRGRWGGDPTGRRRGGGRGEAAVVDPAKRGKALSKKMKKLEAVRAKKDAGEAINAVGALALLFF